MCVPIAIFAFNRPGHLRRSLDALAANDLAAESDITIFCDGPRTDEERPRTEAVRTIARAASGFHSVTVVEREKNYGLATSIITGVTDVLEKHDRIIVLEDDLITSQFFLQYMNQGLDVYAANPKVASIHGWCFPHTVTDPPKTFFLRGADCWGWGTWKRAWNAFEPDAGKLLMQLYKRDLAAAFDLDGTYNYTGMLRDTIEKRVSSWAVRWHASAFLADMYTLYPEHSLVQNIGFDSSGTHCSKKTSYSAPFAKRTAEIVPQQVIESLVMRQAQMNFYKHGNDAANSFRAKGKSLLKDFLPPVLLRCIQKFRHRSHTVQTVTWQGDYPDWATAVAASSGYDQDAIFVRVRDAARAVRAGKALWERDSVCFYHEEYNLPLLSALMSVAAWNKGRLRVLDFGGAFGSTYWQHKPLLQNLDTLSWNVVEQPHVVAWGREEFSSDGLQFWPDMQSCAANGPVDVVLFSSVLQYLESPYTLLEQAAALNPQAIILDRTPFAEKGERITVQNVPPEIYPASYACRWLDKTKISTILNSSYRLLPKHSTHIDPPGFYGIVAIRRELHATKK
ncbi:MAG: methyltransferase, TIGR04325 family [Desulfovibrio sp.]|uniref:methyltransferase, TIGR04325 family n=1 Tax=Desulfovibrio sp. TaxID=885 RepID=UPI002A369904|nr:methyltransferase, TIGR04325 family [Desulfovibrio sp.]MDY0260227.1 methyltransferase, TIGR04325 family [Desulfovibrio sp.]